jgi:SHAQKYF class myb-like DNA-binding protein
MAALEYIDDELPLPSFAEIFGDGGPPKKKKKGIHGKSESSVNEESTGRWTAEEHRLFLEGIMLYGKDWKKMQPLIKTRTLVQIRTHAQKVQSLLAAVAALDLSSHTRAQVKNSKFWIIDCRYSKRLA